jgi:heme-degrading monooxygenase HmoA
MKNRTWLGIGVSMILMLAQVCPAAEPPAQEKTPTQGFPNLVAALKKTPGCLGVENARTGSGKQVIFAWFEDKKAVLNWYNSETHQKVMKQFFGEQSYRKPLKDVPDDSGPILAIASVTFADKPQFKETQLPISQIAIELYQPVAGGVFLGGRFAPESLKVPKMKDYSPKEKEQKK